MNERYLITGGCGFIGSNYVRRLVQKGDARSIVVVDKLTYAGNLANIESEIEKSEVEFVHADICDSVAMDLLFKRVMPTVVVHFAAESHVDRSIDGPTPFVVTNVLGTQVLLETTRRLCDEGILKDFKRFVQVSTDEVYGHLEIDCPEGNPVGIEGYEVEVMAYGTDFFRETTPLNPTSPYSASKASADMLALAYAKTYGLPVVVTRCSNNYGPYQFPEKLIPLMINNIMEGKKLPVYGKGLNVRDWLHVDDHCRAIDAVIASGKNGEVYNVGGFNERRNIDLVRRLISTVRELVESEPRYAAMSVLPASEINDSLISFVKDRPAHDARYAIDSTKLMRSTGWQPQVDFDNGGLKETVRWYLENRGWIEKIVNGEYRDYYRQMYSER